MEREVPYNIILVPIDGSDSAMSAIDHATAIAAVADAVLHVVHVIDRRIVMAADDDMRDELESSLTTEGQSILNTARERVGTDAVPVETSLVSGTPSKEILAQAESAGADLIVIGRSGKSPREKLMGMGSVSERVVDGAPVPVMVVRPSTD